MFRALIPLLTLLCVLGSCERRWKNDGTNRSIENESKRFVSKHGLELKALRRKENKDGLIERVHVGYFAHQLFDVDEAREAVVEVVEQLLQRLNGDDRSRTHLASYPFTGDQIDMVLKVDHFFGDYFDGTYVGRIVLTQGLVYYYSFDGKLTNRESYGTAREILRDKKMEELRVADSYNSEYKQQWINEMRHSARVEELREELASEHEVAELKRQERHERLERQAAQIPAIRPGPEKEKRQASSARPVGNVQIVQEESSQSNQAPTVTGSAAVKAQAPETAVRRRELPQLVDNSADARVQGMPSLDETVYHSYEAERDLAKPMPQIGEALIDSLIFGLIDEEVQAMTGEAKQPVVDAELVEAPARETDDDLLELAERLTAAQDVDMPSDQGLVVESEEMVAEEVFNEELSDAASTESTEAFRVEASSDVSEAEQALENATETATADSNEASVTELAADPSESTDAVDTAVVMKSAELSEAPTGPLYGPMERPLDYIVQPEADDSEHRDNDPFADLDEEVEEFVWLDEALEEEEEELYWSTSQDLEIVQTYEDQSYQGEPELEAALPAEMSPEALAERIVDRIMGPQQRPEGVTETQEQAKQAAKLPPVELELEALLDLHQEYTEDWLDIQLGAQDSNLEEVEVIPMDEELPDLEDALIGTGLWNELPERPAIEMQEVAEEAPKLETNSQKDDFIPASPSLWQQDSSQSDAGSDGYQDDEFTAAAPKAYDGWGGAEEMAEIYEDDKWNAR